MFPATGDISCWFSRSLRLALAASSPYGLEKKADLFFLQSKYFNRAPFQSRLNVKV